MHPELVVVPADYEVDICLPRQALVFAHREMGHGGGPCMLHNSSYDFNDDLIPLGATYWVRLAEAWLAQGRA